MAGGPVTPADIARRAKLIAESVRRSVARSDGLIDLRESNAIAIAEMMADLAAAVELLAEQAAAAAVPDIATLAELEAFAKRGARQGRVPVSERCYRCGRAMHEGECR